MIRAVVYFQLSKKAY
nr:hypothetical protein [Xenorhabdus poinarii]CDN33392.1 hypothetical protein [Xenorhabdus poinarii]